VFNLDEVGILDWEDRETKKRIQDLHNDVHGSVAELMFNLDEVGISDWEDRKTRKQSLPP
jgi:hypothetical protein